MLTGTAKISELFSDLPTISSFDIEPVTLENVEIVQIQYEISSATVHQLLPPALHPTLPSLGIWTAWSVSNSPWGTFRLVQVRLSCRSGARPRTFLLRAVTDNIRAATDLAKQWGLRAVVDKICFNRRYESASFCVCLHDDCVLDVTAKDPENLTPNDLQFFANMHASNTPKGIRMVQFDPQFEVHRAERYTPQLDHFDGRALDLTHFKPVYPVIGFGCNATVHLPKLRFLCRTDVSAFEGSEAV